MASSGEYWPSLSCLQGKREISAPLSRARSAPTGSPSTVQSGTNGGSRPSVGTVTGIPIVPENFTV
jgi:hypothetical protein